MHLAADAVARLAAYVQLVAEASRLTNLTGFRGEEAFIRDGVFHSLSLLPLAEGKGPVVDVGSGVGMPGMVWAAAMPDRRLTLCEMRPLRARFLESTAQRIGVTVEVVKSRAEALSRTPRRASFEVGVARAVGALPYLTELILPLLAIGGRAILPKGPSQRAEIAPASELARVMGGRLHTVGEPDVLGEGRLGFVAIIEKETPTPSPYPRSSKRVGTVVGTKV